MTRIYAWLIFGLSTAFAVAPALTSPFSGFEADQLPNPQMNPPVQPAGYAFAIWGLIYAWLIISASYGVWKRRDDPVWNAPRPALAISLAIGVPWLAIANASAVWATITIWLMALFAIIALVRAPVADRWLFQAPVGIYAGWLTAASFVSLGSTAAGYNILTDQYYWAIICIIGALAVATFVYTKRPSAPEYLFTVIWALVGIIVANGMAQPIISALAAGGIVALLLTMLRWRGKGAVGA